MSLFNVDSNCKLHRQCLKHLLQIKFANFLKSFMPLHDKKAAFLLSIHDVYNFRNLETAPENRTFVSVLSKAAGGIKP